jgi:predicted ATPase
MEFKYPISVIAGKNGSGKSTLLAMAACAYHNSENGYISAGRSKPYYTFSDFFVQTADESPPEGIHIDYRILYNKWRKSKTMPDGIGAGRQVRKKRVGGRWNDYDKRVERNVLFYGVQRVVPHSEQSACRSYRKRFKETELQQDWEKDLCKVAGRIMAKPYTNFELHQHSKYRLPVVNSGRRSSKPLRYSGFNMGAGENAVFSILTGLFEAGPGSLLVIDEIELGLHEKAQVRLVDELKKLCEKKRVQIICSSHSSVVINSIPPEGRFYIESLPARTNVIPGISAEYAAGKLSGRNSGELDIFVEDYVATDILGSVLDQDIRERTNVIPIGSDEAVIKQMAARFKEKKKSECLAILDGDKKNKKEELVRHFLGHLENVPDKETTNEWIRSRLMFLPGNTLDSNSECIIFHHTIFPLIPFFGLVYLSYW